MTTDTPTIGHNGPPEPTPFEAAEKAVNDICDEARMWCDGAPVENDEHADGVGNLIAKIREAHKQAEDAREAELAPLTAQVAAIRSKYSPLIADNKSQKGKTVIALAACKAALEKWLVAKDAAAKAEARRIREEADAKQREAEAALRASDAANIAEREAAEVLLADAKKADLAANRAARQTVVAGGAFGRSVRLTTRHEATMTGPAEAARWAWKTHREAMQEFIATLAERDIRSGVRSIPGFAIEEKQVAA